jgi:hypothetical protein
MYIEFQISTAIPLLWISAIDNDVHAWAEKFDIPYKTKTVKYTHRVILTCKEHYTLFGLSFDSELDWRFVEPMSIDKTK